MSNPSYVIHWKDKNTGEEGHGKPMELRVAKLWANEMNFKYPHVDHWLVEAEQDFDPLGTGQHHPAMLPGSKTIQVQGDSINNNGGFGLWKNLG